MFAGPWIIVDEFHEGRFARTRLSSYPVDTVTLPKPGHEAWSRIILYPFEGFPVCFTNLVESMRDLSVTQALQDP